MNDINSALTTEQVRDACRRLERAWDSEGLATHAWGGRPVQICMAHEAFEGGLPGRTPKLPLEGE